MKNPSMFDFLSQTMQESFAEARAIEESVNTGLLETHNLIELSCEEEEQEVYGVDYGDLEYREWQQDMERMCLDAEDDDIRFF